MVTFKKFVRDESGATAIEYGLIAAGIAVAIITVVQGLGTKLTSTFTSVQGALKSLVAECEAASAGRSRGRGFVFAPMAALTEPQEPPGRLTRVLSLRVRR
jgi:pilus assembly protein Flp/PilA